MSNEKAIEVLLANGIVTKAEIERVKAKHRAMLDQTVPYSGGARLKPNNNEEEPNGTD